MREVAAVTPQPNVESTMVQIPKCFSRPASAPVGRRKGDFSSIPQPDDLEIVKQYVPAPVRRKTKSINPSDYGKIPKEFDNEEIHDAHFVQLCIKSGDIPPARLATAPNTQRPTVPASKQRPLKGMDMGGMWSAGACFRKLYRTKKVLSKGIKTSRVPGDNVILVERDLGGVCKELVEVPVEIDEGWWKSPHSRSLKDDRRRSTLTTEDPSETPADNRRRSSVRQSVADAVADRRRSSQVSYKSSKEATSALSAEYEEVPSNADRRRSSLLSHNSSKEAASALSAEYEEMPSKRESVSANESSKTQEGPSPAEEGPSPAVMAWAPPSHIEDADDDSPEENAQKLEALSWLQGNTAHLKAMKHRSVTVPKAKWAQMFTQLMADTVVHPHALVYLGESFARSKEYLQMFMDEVYQHELVVSDHFFGSSDSTLAESLRNQAIENSVGNNRQILITNPKHSYQLGEPIITCVIHMDPVTKNPVEYGVRMLPVPLEYSWDALSVIFIDPEDKSIVPDINKEFGIVVEEIPFDVPEISHSPKKSWRKSIGNNWFAY